MAPIKFEENIREKLEGREIQPSAESWKKLSGQLDSIDQNSESRIMWYAIAASFVGIIIVASVFFSREKQLNENDTDFVDVNTSQEENKIGELPIENSVKYNEDKVTIIASEEIESEKIKPIKVELTEKPKQKKKESVVQRINISKTTEAVAKLDVPNKEKSVKSEINNLELNEETILNAKVEEVIAKLEQLKIDKTMISMEELDALLANAQKEIQNQRLLSSKKVDPAALLGDVEMELEKSFRDKVYYALGDGFQFIKTAVVERNN